jgi:ABC-type phosphate transport system ATPase subunit
MKSPDPVNTVYNNDQFSDELKEAYDRWMGGDTFQNTNLKDVHEVSADSLEAGVLDLKEAPFDGMDPQSHGAEIENVAVRKKETKKVNPVGSKETVVSKEETESKLWDEISAKLTELGELSGTKYRVVGDQPATVEGYKNKKIAKIMSVKK